MTALAGYWSYSDGNDPVPNCARMLRGQSFYGREDKVAAVQNVALGRYCSLRPDQDASSTVMSSEGGFFAVSTRKTCSPPVFWMLCM
jgi:hypothetical protein